MRMAEGRSTLARAWLPVHVFVSWMRTPFPYTGLPTLQDAWWALLVSMADEFSPEVANENSPLRYGLVATVSAGRLDIGNVG